MSQATSVTGDYNGDGVVDAADYTVWRNSLGALVAVGSAADGNGDGRVTVADHATWASNYGNDTAVQRVELTWEAVDGAASYNVKRSNQIGGPYATIATGVLGTAFSDPEPLAGSAFYVVTAVVEGSETAISNEAIPLAPGVFGDVNGVVTMDAEDGQLGGRWQTIASAAALGGEYIVVNPAFDNATSTPITEPDALATYHFNLRDAGNYQFMFRVLAPSASDDSFFWRIDGGQWITENQLSGSGFNWFTRDNSQVDQLSAGDHVLEIAYRENGTGLDQFKIQPQPVLPAVTYYVSTDGNDAAAGNANNPFATIARAASLVQPGDTVLIRGGTYTEQNIRPATSGSAKQRITFMPEPGSGAVVIRNAATSATGSTNTFNLSSRNYIVIEGLQFENSPFANSYIFLSASDENVITNNSFTTFASGITTGYATGIAVWVGSGSDGNTIHNNTFATMGYAVSLNSSSGNTVSNNLFSNIGNKSIDFQTHSDGNNLIAFNEFNNAGEAIYGDRDASNNLVVRNYSQNSSHMLWNESRNRDNWFYENISNDDAIGYESAAYTETGWTHDARLVGNVFYSNNLGVLIHKSENDELRNNIVVNGSSFGLRYTNEALEKEGVFRNNLIFNSGSNTPIELGGNYRAPAPNEPTSPASKVTVGQFEAVVDASNTLAVDPRFVDPNAGPAGFALNAATSPAINAGDDGVDLGAYAVYGFTSVGVVAGATNSAIGVGFGAGIVEVLRGDIATLRVELSGEATSTVTVDVTPVAGDAEQGVDFDLSSMQLIFAPGETVKVIDVSTLGVADHHELVTLSLNVVSGDVHFVRKYAGVKILSEPLRKDSVGGYVFHDVNADGVRRHDDAPVEGRTVILRDSSGNQLASTTTDADGRYGFAGFAVGNYIVDFGSGQFTTPYAANFAIDSDAQPNGRTQVISVSENYRQTWIDAGILAGAISGSLFVDLNGDGIENEGRYLADRAIDLYSEQGDLVASTVTDVNGWYQFANLQAGNYIVDFGDGPFTAMGVGAETTDSDANPTDGRSGVIQIVTGQHASNIDAGVLLGPFQELGGVVAMEAENGQLGVNWQVTSDLAASGAAYIQIDPAKNHTGASPASTAPEDVVEYDFNITTGGNYKLWFRMLAPTPNDDSFFWRLDGGGWNEVNQATGVGVWFSRDNSQTDSLAAGNHTLALAYRENGTGIDKFVLQLDSLAAPTGDGPTESSRGGVTSFALSANAVTLLAASTTAPPRPYYQRSVPVQAANEEGAAANEEAFALIALNISLSEPNDGSQVLEPEEWTADQSDSTEWLDELAIELVLRHALIFG